MTHSIRYKLAIHPTKENEIWVSDGNAGGFWRTVDNGETWEKLNDGLTIVNWEGKTEAHSVGRFFLTGNEKNAAYAIAFTIGYLNETYSTTRGRVLYRDNTTDGWVNISDGLPKVVNLNRMLPFYKEGVIRLATNNGIWERELVDAQFKPIAQPMILNAGSGDNTQSGYPRTIQLDCYSIVNQNGAEWHWEVYPAPLSMSADNVRNPVITIEPDQTYDITLTVTTPAGSDTKKIEGMIKGSKPVPDATSVDAAIGGKELLLTSGNVVAVGESFRFVARDLVGDVSLVVYDAKGSVLHSTVANGEIEVPTACYTPGVYFYMATDAAGFKKTGKLLVKE
jgi:hypothetical protein